MGTDAVPANPGSGPIPGGGWDTDPGTEPAPAPRLAVTSEVGTLRTVLLHRPGNELRRLTPRNNDQLLFDGIPWVERAQQEHDTFAGVLRDRGVEVLLLADLLAETLAVSGAARIQGISAAVDARRLGHSLADELAAYLRGVPARELAEILMAGMTFDELPFGPDHTSLVRRMHHGGDFVIDPLPNLLFTRDSSFWVGPRVAITALALPARMRETSLTDLVYAFHPRFLGVRRAYESHTAPIEGGDVLLLAPGVLAVGVGERTSPAGAEALARSLFDDNLAHTVLVVPIAQNRATMHLDTVCTMVDTDAVVMYSAVRETLSAFTIHRGDDYDHGGTVTMRGPDPFLPAAADAMGIGKLRVIDTGLDGVTAEREQWDDGNNTLALRPGVVIAYERNEMTNARLLDAGIEVLPIPGSELGSGRGGPRCLSCPLSRDDV
ncbi:arginine deiminase [Nocardia cyriacigeorgica]|uniref:arginine deiminase n=1 Tax=Nocardia cyriacigeorgica TaxID=135487 RepID=UPI002453DB82|nr:arginine deiminase [Nocardia cyriacigeorgica]